MEHCKKYSVMTGFKKDFEIKEVLGQGKYGTVHRAIRLEDNQEFAVKILDKQNITKNNEKQVALNEIQIQRQLNQAGFYGKGILNQLYLYESKNKIYLVTELYKGVTLMDYINMHYSTFTEQDCLNILHKQLTKLASLEELNIVHRDIKPSNIIVNETKHKIEVSIVDFGLSCKTQYSMKSGQMQSKFVVGSGGYMCPEILRGQSYDTSADVFSLGAIFHLLQFGNQPFVKDNYEDTILANKICDYGNILQENMDLQGNFITQDSTHLLLKMMKDKREVRPLASQLLRTNIMVYIRRLIEEVEQLNLEERILEERCNGESRIKIEASDSQMKTESNNKSFDVKKKGIFNQFRRNKKRLKNEVKEMNALMEKQLGSLYKKNKDEFEIMKKEVTKPSARNRYSYRVHQI